MPWCRPGANPLSEPMVASLQTHICITQSQWVKKGDIILLLVATMYTNWSLSLCISPHLGKRFTQILIAMNLDSKILSQYIHAFLLDMYNYLSFYHHLDWVTTVWITIDWVLTNRKLLKYTSMEYGSAQCVDQYKGYSVEKRLTWWRHQMETFAALLAICAGKKASDPEVWCFLWSAPERKIKQTIVRLAIWDAIAPIMTSHNEIENVTSSSCTCTV